MRPTNRHEAPISLLDFVPKPAEISLRLAELRSEQAQLEKLLDVSTSIWETRSSAVTKSTSELLSPN